MGKDKKVGSITFDVAVGVQTLVRSMNDAKRIVATGMGDVKKSIEDSTRVFNTGIGSWMPSLTAANQGLSLFTSGWGLLAHSVETAMAVLEKGERFDKLSAAFGNLYGQTTLLANDGLGKLKEVTEGLIGGTTLLAAANKAALAQVKPEQFLEVAKGAQALAETVGGETTQAFNDLTEAIVSGRARGLKAAYGLAVDNDEAYRKYAATLGTTADKLSDFGQRQAVAAEVVVKLKEKVAELPAPISTAGEALEKLKTAMDGILTQGSSLVNNIPQVVSSFEMMAKAAQTASWFTGALARAVRAVNTDSASALEDRIRLGVSDLQLLEETKKNQSWIFKAQDAVASTFGKGVKNRIDEIKQAVLAAEFQLAALNEKREEAIGNKPPPSAIDPDKVGKAAEEARKKIQEMLRGLDADLNTALQKSVEDELETAIKDQNFADFQALTDNVADAVAKGYKEAHQKEIDAGFGVKVDETAALLRQNKLEEEWGKFDAEASRLAEKQGKDTEKALTEAYQNSLSFFDSLFQNTITGQAFDTKAVFQSLGASLASGVASGLSGGLKESSIKDLGHEWGQQFTDWTDQLFNLGIFQRDSSGAVVTTTKDGKSTPEYQEGGEKKGETIAAGVVIATSTLAAILDAERINNQAGDYSGTGAAVGTLAGGVIGAAFGGAAGAAAGASLGNMLGSLVGTLFKPGGNAETKARKAFDRWFEGKIQGFYSSSFYNAGGQLQTGASGNYQFLMNSTNGDIWNAGTNGDTRLGWQAQAVQDYGETATGVFMALGEAIKGVAGITENVGDQIGYALLTNFAGNIDNARMLVQKLGLSLEELSKNLMDSAMQGNMRWAEYNVNISNLGEAFKPGLAAVGAYQQAWENLIQSGGRGIEAVISFRNIAVEANEAGLSSLQDLQQALINGGASPEQVGAWMQALHDAGLTNIQDIISASNEQLGPVVGQMEMLSSSLGDAWTSMADDIQGLTDKLNAIPKEINVAVNVNVNNADALDTLSSSGSSDTSVTANARGGVFDQPMLFKSGTTWNSLG